MGNMSKIFISWSKNKSEELAKLTKHTLEELLPDTNFLCLKKIFRQVIVFKIQLCIKLNNVIFLYFVLLPIIKNLRGYYTKQDMLVGCINELFQFYLIKILYGIHG